MTEQHDKNGDAPDMLDDRDLELLTDYLAKALDPEQVALVKRRLEEDEAFRTMAAPLIAAWELPPRWKSNPMPRAELEKHWDDFTKRVGFVHQRRKARRRNFWLLAIVVAVVGLSGFLLQGKVRAAIADARDYEQVPYDTGWIRLRDGSRVLLSSGSRLRALKKPNESMLVQLVGSARFRAEPEDTSDTVVPLLQPLGVGTANGKVFAPRAHFTVTIRGDTTDVEVHRPFRRAFLGGAMPMPTTVYVHDGVSANPLRVNETERARVVRGSKAVKLTSIKAEP